MASAGSQDECRIHGIVDALRDRPVMLERRRDGEVFFQRREPQGAPARVPTVRGPEYDLVCPDGLATVAWMVNLGAVTFHPWPVRRDALRTPDQDDRGARVYVDRGPRTVASAYSIRRGGLSSAPVTWDELDHLGPEDFTVERFAP